MVHTFAGAYSTVLAES